jgi:hypothetical protein
MSTSSGDALSASDRTGQVSDTTDSGTDMGPEFPIKMGNAENILFTDTGRIFMTGANVAEITKDGAVMLMPSEYSSMYAGLAQVGPWLYVICGKNYETMPPLDLAELLQAKNILDKLVFLTDAMMDKVLLRADLRAGGPDKLVFEEIHHFDGMMLPNGMAADSQGNLYVADETFLPQGKIVKVTVSSDAIPVTTQETWASAGDGVNSPNGMCIRDDVLYFTDFNINSSKPAQVKKVAINSDGSAGTVETVYSAMGLFDDLDAVIYNGRPTLAVASFFAGSVLIIDEENGTVAKAGGGKLQSPSSAHFGNGGWIAEDELIVTEVGMLYEPYSNFGNQVNVITVP